MNSSIKLISAVLLIAACALALVFGIQGVFLKTNQSVISPLAMKNEQTRVKKDDSKVNQEVVLNTNHSEITSDHQNRSEHVNNTVTFFEKMVEPEDWGDEPEEQGEEAIELDIELENDPPLEERGNNDKLLVVDENESDSTEEVYID